jgi:hypothetical protein
MLDSSAATVLVVLGSQLVLGFALWVVNGHWARKHGQLLSAYQELTKQIWVGVQAEKPEVAQAATMLGASLQANPDSHVRLFPADLDQVVID